MINRFLCLSFLLSLFLICDSAYAILGKKSSLRQTQRSGTRPGHRVHQEVTAGTGVREHSRSDGVVYGIAWSGLTHPELTSLLGNYSSEYSELNRKAVRTLGKRSRQLKSQSLVVERWGHMRNLRGRVYDPALVPEGVNPDEIQ